MPRWMCLSVSLLALGCSRPNPAFDTGNQDSAATDGPESGSLDTGESSASGSSTTTDPTDPSTTDPTDPSTTTDPTDPSTTDPTDTDTDTSTDTGVGECPYGLGERLQLAVRLPDPNCPPNINGVAMLLVNPEFNQQPGVSGGYMCQDVNCTSCSDVVNAALGAPGYAELSATWELLGGLIEDNGIDGLCVELIANTPLGMANGMCSYGALGLFDHSIEHGPIFIGQLDAAPLTKIAEDLIGAPTHVPLGTCSCASLFDASPAELMCCEDSGVEPSFFKLQLLGLTLEPGQSAGLDILQVPWQARLLQSQNVATCSNPDGMPRQAWALTRTM